MVINFEITGIEDVRKSGSEIEIGVALTGTLDDTKSRVYYTDRVGTEWVFYVGDTCNIIEKP